MAAAYPLTWPDGWERSKYQVNSSFVSSGEKAYKFLSAELSRLGATSVVISTNVPLAITTGRPKMDRQPVDAGVAVYFTRNGKQFVFACDKYEYLWENIQALGKTIEAIRGIERWGASDLMERAFAGFKALASHSAENWWDVLGCSPEASAETIQSNYRSKVRAAHPDTGGSVDAMSRLNVARDAGLKVVTP